MIKSMTGFGRSEAMIKGIKITVEIRSVNHRYHEIMFKMPKEFLPVEDRMKKTIQQYLKRGRIDAYITLNMEGNSQQALQVDWNLATDYFTKMDEIKTKFHVGGQLEIKDLLMIPDLFHIGQDMPDVEEFAPDLLHIVEQAAQTLLQMRADEGKRLYDDLSSRINSMQSMLIQVKERAPKVVEEYRTKLQLRLLEWLDGVEIDENRLINEVAFFSEKANIDEEITRLYSHIDQFNLTMQMKEPVGRKLDFLTQEMNREVNTIGSKANDIIISQVVVEMKSELEKVREQVQNIE